jgi:hypothetical protein
LFEKLPERCQQNTDIQQVEIKRKLFRTETMSFPQTELGKKKENFLLQEMP